MTPLIFWASVAGIVVVGAFAAAMVIALALIVAGGVVGAVLRARRFISARIE